MVCTIDPLLTEPLMIVSPSKQVPVKGLANICRYLSRQFCPELYESKSPVDASLTDSWLDALTSSYLYGSTKGKSSFFRNMNACLGKTLFLTGSEPTLADVVVYSVIGTQHGLKFGANVDTWMRRCHGVKEMVEVPFVYLS